MESAPSFGELIGTALSDWGGKLVAIPAGYAIGAWMGTTIAFLAGYDRDFRTDLRDLFGICGGAAGCVVWVWTSL